MRTTYNNAQRNNDGDNGDGRHPRHHGRGRGGFGKIREGFGPSDFGRDAFGPSGFGSSGPGTNPGSGQSPDRGQYRRGGFGPGGRGPGGFGTGGSGAGDFGGAFGPDDGRGHPFGPRGPRQGGGPRGPRGRGFRARKGDIRLAILSILGDTPSNGYGLMQAIAEKSGGAWRPSPGSVYPTLAQLVDENLIATTGEGDNDRRSAFQLTEAGTAYVAEQAEAIKAAWSTVTEESEVADPLAVAARKLVGVIRQLDSDGTEDQRTQAIEQIDELRRSLYRMLGE